MGVKNPGKLERELLEELNDVAKSVDRPALEAIGEGIVKEMKAMISRGISPILGAGRFPEYKVKTRRRDAEGKIKASRQARASVKRRQAEAKKITKRTRTAAKLFRLAGKISGSKAAKRKAKDLSRRGKQSALKSRLLGSDARRRQGKIGAAVAAKKEIKGYPYSVQKRFPGKRPRPVNLFLSGDFLKALKYFVFGGNGAAKASLEIGFSNDDELANDMEEGHRIGWLGQGKRPIIPQGSERFAERIDRAVERILGAYIAKRLRSRGR